MCSKCAIQRLCNLWGVANYIDSGRGAGRPRGCKKNHVDEAVEEDIKPNSENPARGRIGSLIGIMISRYKGEGRDPRDRYGTRQDTFK